MPMLPVSLPSVWTVPVAAGVPLLLGQSRATGAKAAASVTIGTVLEDALVTTAAGQWGIFNNAGQNVLSAARVMSVGGEATHHIASAPLEDGGFLSYSKVASPRLHRVLMVCDGSETGFNTNGFSSGLSQAVSALTGAGDMYVRKSFFETLSALEADLSLYSVITPERKYDNVNITGHRWVRDARHGVTMPVVEIILQEVRLSASQTLTSSYQPYGQRVICGGVVPAQSYSAAQSASSVYDTSLAAPSSTSWAEIVGNPL